MVPVRPSANTEGFEAGSVAKGWVGRPWSCCCSPKAFFLKHAFENQWIREVGRVTLGMRPGWGCAPPATVPAAVLSRPGPDVRRRRRCILYLATFAAFGYYHLLPQQHASVFLVILVAETAAMAVLYEAPAIALMAVIGSLLTPVLLRTEHDQYQALFLGSPPWSTPAWWGWGCCGPGPGALRHGGPCWAHMGSFGPGTTNTHHPREVGLWRSASRFTLLTSPVFLISFYSPLV